ncbi:hypothetical protein J5N97_016077 [Dioscorea zingiberensis]|uniref:Uncharacterized protein n=1 Tax=Dioscorea zingiberensis TaxID=325984 RepID=A0A9D5CK94_9LILI|nr:hypothetical protein J5N97_016077 [Dioscorea zingiberensis]
MAWKGQCVEGEKFNPATACNRKLIGARYYLSGFERDYGPLDPGSGTEYRSPRDGLGHGSHTSSTAVGSAVKNASFFGLAAGTAHGGAPRARLAMYKICWFKDLQGRCSEADIMAAFDDALNDGVHVISASIGASPPLVPFFASGTEIGSFHAAQMGVVVVFSAGNDGPDSSLVQNVAPWSLCVAAGTIDRRFPTEIKMPNNDTFVGEGFITENMRMPLIDSSTIFTDGSCSTDKWNGNSATKKIILCFSTVGPVSSFGAAIATYVANGSGVIFVDAKVKLTAQDDFIPTVHVDLHQGTQILYQLQSSPKIPVVQISRSKTSIGRTPAPSVAFFSSRGPNSLSPNILKPDITAPGVNILAAWPPKTPPTLIQIDRRSVKWNFDSGTSMSCPHISGIVALLKSAHPTWSPAMIKSALMTTAYMGDTTADKILAGGSLKAADAFDLGAGYVNPLKAMDPGLVYDMNTQDYIYYLCSLGYTKEQLKLIVLPSPDIKIECRGNNHSDLDLNYPAIVLSDLQSSSITVKRTLWNVGKVGAAYFASVESPQGVVAFVWPRYIVFSNEKEKVSYYVTVKAVKQSQGRFDFGEIVWCDGYHYVRTPLVVRVNNV